MRTCGEVEVEDQNVVSMMLCFTFDLHSIFLPHCMLGRWNFFLAEGNAERLSSKRGNWVKDFRNLGFRECS